MAAGGRGVQSCVLCVRQPLAAPVPVVLLLGFRRARSKPTMATGLAALYSGALESLFKRNCGYYVQVAGTPASSLARTPPHARLRDAVHDGLQVRRSSPVRVWKK